LKWLSISIPSQVVEEGNDLLHDMKLFLFSKKSLMAVQKNPFGSQFMSSN
jgi:hypothetical protein